MDSTYGHPTRSGHSKCRSVSIKKIFVFSTLYNSNVTRGDSLSSSALCIYLLYKHLFERKGATVLRVICSHWGRGISY